jgi:D-alanine--poly(phosphoribitol) ligase subunit 1
MNIKPYTYNQTITQLFEKTVLTHPDNIAVYLDTDKVTYKKFNEDVNQYAHYLREKGVARNLVVAVEIPRSYKMLCIIFAIMKAGGVYLPINPNYPEKRKKQIIEDAEVKFLIVDSNPYLQVSDLCYTLKSIDVEVQFYSKANLIAINKPDDTAYVIYTSGSTGAPKGVMIAHHSLINRIEWMQDLFPISTSDVLFQKTDCGFDVSIWELFWWSITGAGLTLLPAGKEEDVILIFKIIFEKKVTVIHFVPTVLRIFLEYIEIGNKISKLNYLKFVFSSGEVLDINTVNNFNKLFDLSVYPQLVNLYGPTEATIDVTYFVCDKKTNYREIPIGKPVYNVELMVLDDLLMPQQSDQVGELYISGACLAKGYLNNPEQTKRCFLQLSNNPTKIIYKTGDLVKWNNDNQLCYIGRKDQQVKINGIRIELGEIEYHLNAYKNIAHATVLYLTPNNSIKKLVAFIKLRGKSIPIEISDLKLFMHTQLPEYMIPQHYIIIDEYPLKDNGKLDKDKLKEVYKEGIAVT